MPATTYPSSTLTNANGTTGAYYTPTSYYTADWTAPEQASNLATDTAASNLAASGYDTELTDLINSVNESAQQSLNAGRLGTGGQAIQNQLVSNTAANAQGYLDPATLANIESNAAQQWGSAGFGVDTPAMSAAAERAMILTSQGLESQAATEYGNLLAENPSAPLYSMQNLLVSPSEYASTSGQYASSANQNAQNNANAANTAAQNAATTRNNALTASTTPASATSGTTNRTPTASGGSAGTPIQPTTGTQRTGSGYAGAATSLGATGNDPAPMVGNTTSEGAPIGSSILGSTYNGYDMMDPSGVYSSLFGSYGSMPDYSTGGFTNTAGAPTNANLAASGGTTAPPNTVYDPTTDTYVNTFGLDQYYQTTPSMGFDIGSTGLSDYQNQVFNDYFAGDY